MAKRGVGGGRPEGYGAGSPGPDSDPEPKAVVFVVADSAGVAATKAYDEIAADKLRASGPIKWEGISLEDLRFEARLYDARRSLYRVAVYLPRSS